MARVHTINSLLLLLSLVSKILAQAPLDPLRNFCWRFGHQTAVIDRKLYIDGGWLYANSIEQNPVPVISEAVTFQAVASVVANEIVDRGLLYDDLDVNGDGMPKQYANLTKNNSIPAVAGGVLWPDEVNKVFWLFGGEFSSAPSPFQLWGYDVILNQWNLSTPSSNSDILRTSYGAGAASSEAAKGFFLGGYLNSLTNPRWIGPQMATSNLVIFNMVENSLTNTTGPSDKIGRAEGTMVFIPSSAAGLLIYFGGVTFPYGNATEVGVRCPLHFAFN
jgi:hypothetical protein